MLMTDDTSNLCSSIYDFSELDDELGPSIDMESFLSILREGPDPFHSENCTEESSQKNVQQGAPGEHIPGPITLSPPPSFNEEALLLGSSGGSFEPSGDPLLEYDFTKLTEIGSPVHSFSGSFTDWMLPIPGQGTLFAERDGVTRNDSSCSRGYDEFSKVVVNPDTTNGKYADPNKCSLKTSATPDLAEASIMDIDIPASSLYCSQSSTYEFPDISSEIGDQFSAFPYCMTVDDTIYTRPPRQFMPDSFNLELTLNSDQMVVNKKDEAELLPPHSTCLNSAVILEDEGGKGERGSKAQKISNLGFRGSYIKCEGNKLISSTNGINATIINDKRVISKGATLLLPNNPSETSALKHGIHMKDERNGQDVDVHTLEKSSVRPLTSTEKRLICSKYERESKPAHPKTVSSHPSKVVHRTSQSSVSFIDSHVDDDPDICILEDPDVCILEDMSEPTRLNPYSTNGNSIVTAKRSISEPLHYNMGVGGVRLKTNDERLIFRAALQDLSQPRSEVSPPDGVLAVPLLRHQRIALSWMVKKETGGLQCSGGILADDQGLGKTISTIALILKERSPSSRQSLVDTKPIEIETLNLDDDDDDDTVSELDGPKEERNTSVQAKGRLAAGTLVVCPTSVLRQWADELQNKVTTEAGLSVLVYHGGNRTKDPFELAKYDVVLTTYAIVSMEVPKQPLVDKDDDETVKREALDVPPIGLSSSKKRKYPPSSGKRSKKGIDSELLESVARPLARVGWFRVVLDEAQSIKNHRTQVARACWGLRAKRRWCLSGTPIQNAVDDLYSYFRFLRYDPYAVYKSFCSAIKVPINKNPTNGYKKLQAVLKTVMLRRTKGTLLDGEPIIALPPKTIELKKVDFTKEERDFYCRLEADSRAQFAEYAAAGTVKQNYVNILLMLLRLRQACDHPLLVRGYDSSSVWKSSVEMAKKLPQEKLGCLLNCLEASLAICSICNDPPEDAVVTNCGHVYCNQCICEHLSGDDNQCPSTNCKAKLSTSSVFSRGTLKSALSEQPNEDLTELADRVNEPCSGDNFSSFDSSKIKAALEVLKSLSKPPDRSLRISYFESIDESSSCPKDLSDTHSGGSPRDTHENIKFDLDQDLNDSVKIVGDKAIVFSQWTKMLDLLEACLKSSSIQYRRLDGTMSVVARDKAVKDFNTLPEVSVMIMSLKAASLGLNMVAACHVLLLDLWWNPTTEDQAIDRAHRIGQTRPVKVLRLTVKDTVEDRILALQQKKREMVASAFGEDETGSRETRLTVDDLKYLFMV